MDIYSFSLDTHSKCFTVQFCHSPSFTQFIYEQDFLHHPSLTDWKAKPSGAIWSFPCLAQGHLTCEMGETGIEPGRGRPALLSNALSYYLLQGGYVFTPACLFVCRLVGSSAGLHKKTFCDFQLNLVEGCNIGQERTCYILVQDKRADPGI